MGASEVHLSYSNGATDVPLIEKTIGRLFDEVCSTYEHNDALVSKHQALRYTYGELRKRVDEVAFSLLSLGVKKGDRVGIWSPNNA
jgi:fatty-acyl-CoA synthase